MGGGSCGCGMHEGGGKITLELVMDKETVLWIDGVFNADNSHKDTKIINWTSGGSRIGVYLSPGEKTLSEQQGIFYNCAQKKFPDCSYDINVKIGGSYLR